jgi:hypothetical protein
VFAARPAVFVLTDRVAGVVAGNVATCSHEADEDAPMKAGAPLLVVTLTGCAAGAAPPCTPVNVSGFGATLSAGTALATLKAAVTVWMPAVPVVINAVMVWEPSAIAVVL